VPARGFTLIELVVVMGLLSVLMGLGIGFLQRRDTSVDQVLGILRAELRGAALTARAHEVPTAVIVTDSKPDAPGYVRSRTLVPLASWHLEPGEIFSNPALRPELGGVDEPAGRYGHARRPDFDAQGALFSVPAGSSRFPLEDGFVLRLDLKLEAALPMVVLRLGEGVRLELDADLVPELRLVPSVGGRRGPGIVLRGTRPAPLHRWFTLEVLHTGQELVLSLDGARTRQDVSSPLHQLPSDLLEISPEEGPIAGVVDEIALFAYELSEPQILPSEVEVLGLDGPLVFGRLGRLSEPVSFELRSGDELGRYTVETGGVVR
jgi:prepilin-type N-terminal cleavage/methylation domain-containing protein